MIYDDLQNSGLYPQGNDLMAAALQFARQCPPDQPDGRYEIRGNDVYALVMNYRTVPPAEKKWEAHRNYIDVQLVLSGTERMDVAVSEPMKVSVPYNPEKDVELYAEAAQFCSLILKPGLFALLYPHDVHRPGCLIQNPEQVRKMVLKIRV